MEAMPVAYHRLCNCLYSFLMPTQPADTALSLYSLEVVEYPPIATFSHLADTHGPRRRCVR